ncbi:MAG: MlaD family protein [Sulfurovum sp.]|nr:MlaD family protein [Sulfurovum sp.]
MYNKVNYTIVGLFVLLFGVAMTAFFFWLAKYGLQQKYDVYKIYMKESVSGLSKDSVVKLRGVSIGRVREIRIDPNNIERIEILLSIKHGILIKENMVAYMAMQGLTGLLAVDIKNGTNDAKTLEPTKDYIPTIKTASSWFNATKKDIGTLTGHLSRLVQQVNKLMSNKNIEHLDKMLQNMEALTDVFKDVGHETIPVMKKLMETTQNFNRVTLKIERSLDRGDYNIKKIFEPMIIEAEILSEQVNDLATKMNQSPSDIFFKAREIRQGPGE